MSREIKFRAWNNDKNEWLDKEDCKYLTIHLDGSYEINLGWVTIFPHLTIEQYTGLKDKNGKEIYEGDIVELDWYIYGDKPAYRVKSKVIFDEEGARVCNGKHSDLLKYCTGIEVIGNIHENPELLEEK